MDHRQTLIKLADAWARHDGVTHWAISMRLTSKGDFFKRLLDGKDCHTATAQRVIERFSDRWPADLPWPADMPRPRRAEDAA